MAAKLEWVERHAFCAQMFLGPWMLGEVFRRGWEKRGAPITFHYSLTDRSATDGGIYETFDDARQDAESEVRRLLKDAGVVLE